MNLILGDIYDFHIYHHISIIDIYNFSLTCKKYSNIDKLKLLNRLNDIIDIRLNKIFGDKTIDFYDILEKTGGIISGSFILQCILNEKWESDVDIYIPMINNVITSTPWDNPKSEMDDFIYRFYSIFASYDSDRYNDYQTPKIISKMKFIRDFWLLTDDYNNLRTIGEENLRHIIDDNNEFSFNNIQKMKYTKEGRTDFKIKYKQGNVCINNLDFKINKIQVILVDTSRDKMINFINDEYDFDICKNVFCNKNISIHSFNDIVSKMTKFKYTHSEEGSLNRKSKYEKYGFQFKN